ncbi:MAG: ATP-binding protein [Candidatus Lokiarchaeota archaeon]
MIQNHRIRSVGIVSGKGGVGKTSLSASLASLACKDPKINAIVLDCDVDAPNLALILPPNSKNKINSKSIYTTLKATFLEEKCIQCKQCINKHYCEFNALKWDSSNNVPYINYIACEGCGSCQVLCPEHAFKINPVKSGEIISYTTREGFPLIYGRTELGSTTSGKLVSESKESIKLLKEYEKSNLLLIDGPPGIGCPVIATISGLDYVITITEPTPSGLHDLVRVLDVIHQFEIPFGIVINKANIQSSFQKKFDDFIAETKYNVLGKIPFDLNIPKAMSFAKTVIDYSRNSIASIEIMKIYEELKDELKL